MLPRTLVTLVAVLASACWVEEDPPPHAVYRGPASAAPSASAGVVTPSTTPLLVEIDTGRTLNADPGQGVGIFVEYASGGKWHVWWTCDTKKTSSSCAFDLQIRSESGDLETIHSEGVLAGDSVNSSDTRTINAMSNTGDNLVGVRFEAPAHGIITIDATVGGTRDPAYFFFVQDGKPNGGFTGALTNPLRFQGNVE
jgi:hypothetical protein